MLDLNPIKSKLAESRKSRSSMFTVSDADDEHYPWVGIRDDLGDLVDEVERLREAIKAHREGLLRGGPSSELDVTPFDRNLWGVLADEKKEG